VYVYFGRRDGREVAVEHLLKLGQVAAQAGVSRRTVDFYTGLGLLEPAQRTSGGHRLYSPAAVERIAAIRQLEAHGVSLDHIAQALNTPAGKDVPALVDQLHRDLNLLRTAVDNAEPETSGLLAAITARAHSLIITALDIAAAMPPPPV
jgi:DNA-binding transcriptional MerR regulator